MHLYESIPELVVGFDTETTGLDTSLDEAISYGLAVYQNGALVDQHHWFVLPERPIHEGAQKVHGVSRELLENPADDMEVLIYVYIIGILKTSSYAKKQATGYTIAYTGAKVHQGSKAGAYYIVVILF